jgi:molecular chaperone DnaJ
VKIPAGIATGQRMRLYGEGEHGSAGGPTGDLYVVVHVQEHPFFHREGDDLFCEVSVPFHTMALGGGIRVPTLDGPDELNLPSGTQPGARFKLRGKGMPNVSGRGHGDLHVIAKVAVPKKLTKEQKQILEQLARTMPAEKADGDGGEHAEKPFFERVKDIFG